MALPPPTPPAPHKKSHQQGTVPNQMKYWVAWGKINDDNIAKSLISTPTMQLRVNTKLGSQTRELDSAGLIGDW